MSGIWRAYRRVLELHPWKTQATTTGVLMGAGDIAAQLGIEGNGREDYQYFRTLRFFLFGQFLAGPILRTWYLTLDRLYKGASRQTALFKMVTDQAVFAPSFLTFFIGTMGLMRRESIEEVKHKIKRDFKPVVLANYKVWPAVQIVNFYFVPFQHRILVVNVVALGWNTYLAWKAEMKDPLPHVEKDSTIQDNVVD